MVNDKDKIYVKHILDAIANIERFLNGKTRADFDQDQLLIDGVTREIEIIGEASKNISDELKKSTAEIPWKKVAGMRDVIVHDYFSVDLNSVWKTATEDLQPLKSVLEDLIK